MAPVGLDRVFVRPVDHTAQIDIVAKVVHRVDRHVAVVAPAIGGVAQRSTMPVKAKRAFPEKQMARITQRGKTQAEPFYLPRDPAIDRRRVNRPLPSPWPRRNKLESHFPKRSRPFENEMRLAKNPQSRPRSMFDPDNENGFKAEHRND